MATSEGESEISELKLRKAILYKTGLGYFEKIGKIDLDHSKKVNISFKNTVMNDLLKTFSINQLKGKFALAGISYESEDSNQDKLLEDSLIKLSDLDVLHQLISQVRGLDVRVHQQGNAKEGTVIGLQQREIPVGEHSGGTITKEFLILQFEGQVHPIPLNEINQIEILDKTARKDFQFFMEVMQNSKKEKNRTVAIFFQGSGVAEYLLSFLQELPAWKVSYRLFIDDSAEEDDEKTKGTNETKKADETAKNTSDEPDFSIPILIQGWAIIDNILDEDWKDVRLSLVSGLPVSFKYDSYSPLWINRPEIGRNQNISASSNEIFNQTNIPTKPKEEQTAKDTIDAIKQISKTGKVHGSGFRYDIKTPVTVKRNQSSLIPLIQSNGKATKISVYNFNVNPTKPMAALEIRNFCEAVLEEGPISIFHNNIFEGEALLPFMEKEEQQRIPYAVDQGFNITREIKSKTENVHKIEIGHDLYKKYFTLKTTKYSIENLTDQPKQLIIEHPKEFDFDLIEPSKAFEVTEQFLRFKYTIKPTSTEIIEILERRLNSSYENIQHLSCKVIVEWQKLKIISDKQFDFLMKIMDIKQEIEKLNIGKNDLRARKGEIDEEHARIRQNLEVLGDYSADKKIRQRYIKKLESQEAEIEEIEKKIDALDKKMKDKEKEAYLLAKNWTEK